MERRSILWFRSDLRLHDNEALIEANRSSDQVIPVYVFDQRVFFGHTSYGFPKTGVHRARFILESVEALRDSLRNHGSDLVVRIGFPEEIIYNLAVELKTNHVYCNRERTREEVFVQDQLEKRLWSVGQELRFERGKMLFYTQDLPFPVTHTPDAFMTLKKETEHFLKIRQPLPVPRLKPGSSDVDPGCMPCLADLGYDESASKASQNDSLYQGGESAGLARLHQFIQIVAQDPDRQQVGGSRLSPWISQGCLSPKMIYHRWLGTDAPEFLNSSSELVQSLLWRDYFRLMGKKYGDHIFRKAGPRQIRLPDLRNSPDRAGSWLHAETGVPIVDACLTELTSTGHLSHKGRVLVGCYLVHELQVNWQIGAEFFESLLLDYDPCSNYGNWNQLAGVGADPARDKIASISHQEKRLDPDGLYVERWLSKDRMVL